MSGTVTTQVSNPTAADTSPKQIELLPGAPAGAIKIYEPPLKDANDQLVHTLERIEALKNPGASAENYVGAFSPETDQFYVETGNANVTQLENLAALFSTAPEQSEDDGYSGVLILVLALGIGYFLLKGKK